MISFPYRRDAKGDYFPIIELVIFFQNRFARTSALIDSGAITSIFRPDIADQLGINVEKGKEVYLSGVGGRITVSLNLLGRESFFKNFVIVFDEKEKKIELK